MKITKKPDGNVKIEIELTKEQYEDLEFDLNTKEVVYCLQEKDQEELLKEELLKEYLSSMFYLCDMCNQLEHLHTQDVANWEKYSVFKVREVD